MCPKPRPLRTVPGFTHASHRGSHRYGASAAQGSAQANATAQYEAVLEAQVCHVGSCTRISTRILGRRAAPFHHSLFLAASRMVLPKILVLTGPCLEDQDAVLRLGRAGSQLGYFQCSPLCLGAEHSFSSTSSHHDSSWPAVGGARGGAERGITL